MLILCLVYSANVIARLPRTVRDVILNIHRGVLRVLFVTDVFRKMILLLVKECRCRYTGNSEEKDVKLLAQCSACVAV